MSNHPAAVVVVNFDSAALIEANLTPLIRSDPELHAVVVDNRSTDGARSEIAALATREGWTLVEAPGNGGYGSGLNLGVQAARRLGADTFLLLNPDARIDSADLDVLRGRLDERRDAILSPVVQRPDGTPWFDGGALDMVRGRTMSRPVRPGTDERTWLSGACLLTSAEAWDALGGFDDDYFLYWEDVDLSIRAARLGIAVEVVDAARAVHDEGATQRSGRPAPLSRTYYEFNIRNRLVFAAKHLTPRQRRSWYLHTPRESYRILLRGEGRRIFLRPWRPIGCAVLGIFDGLRTGRRVL
ncbi:MAG: glycosyltransferase family 2 protein, partial [Actinobacteria bacterium]|nr:glycosyltransferase family 2 protein [Actinomycetota bacterium]